MNARILNDGTIEVEDSGIILLFHQENAEVFMCIEDRVCYYSDLIYDDVFEVSYKKYYFKYDCTSKIPVDINMFVHLKRI